MITYVNTVLVSNNSGADTLLTSMPTTTSAIAAAKGKFIAMNCGQSIEEEGTALYTVDADTQEFKIGMLTGKYATIVANNGSVSYQPIVKWSNIIRRADIKSIKVTAYSDFTASEDTVAIDFTSVDSNVMSFLAQGGKRIIVRLTFKDLPTRYRKWTESYEYVTAAGDDATAIANGVAALINKQDKRARVVAAAASGVVTLTAMPYDDDNNVDTINVANKVRFNATVYYTDPAAAAFASNNKYFLTGLSIEKSAGVDHPTDAKHVRDHEAQAMGYDGILNRGMGTWPIIKPDMDTDLSATYDGITLEFENMYRAADDIFRKTKQTVEIFVPAGKGADLAEALTLVEGAGDSSNTEPTH